VKVAELFEGVDTPRKRPQSMIQFGAKVAAEQLRKMGLSVRIDTRVIGKHEKSDRTVMTVSGDVEEAEILKVLKKNKVEYATVGSTTKDGKKSRMIRLVTPPLREDKEEQLAQVRKDYKNAMLWVNAPKNEVADHERAKWERLASKLRDHAKKQFKVDLNEALKYEDPKGFGRKLFNKAMGIPSGAYKYKVGDTVKFQMEPSQEGGSGTGKITKLLDGHHYLVNGKPVNQNEIKAKVTEERVDELSTGTLASYRSKRLKQRGEVFAADPYATPKGPKDPLSDKVHTGVHRAYRKELHGKSVEANKKDPGRGSIQRQYYSGESGSRSGD
jgi:hypothetical protein